MKKRRKIEYSMTAKQRKEMNRPSDAPLTEDEIAVIEEQKETKVAKRAKMNQILFVSITCLLVVVLVVAAVAIPKLVGDNVKGNPIAVIKLKDGTTLEMELYKDDAPAAVANFIYLAENGYFDDTIFHDITNGFVSFGGYTQPGTHKSTDENFVKGLKGFATHTENKSSKTNFKLGYRIKRENSATLANEKGLLLFLAGTGTWGTSGHFMMTANNNPQFTFPGNSTAISSYTVMGRYIGEKTLEALDRIYAMESSGVALVNVFRHPVKYDDVRIKSVTIKNISSSYKKNILNNFESYVFGDKEGELDKESSWLSKAYSYQESPINPSNSGNPSDPT